MGLGSEDGRVAQVATVDGALKVSYDLCLGWDSEHV